MNDNKPQLRPHQIEDLAFHIANPKSLNLADPACGKTPTVCVLAYYHWARRQKKTVWAMPLSLLEKNRDEMLRFTDFAEADVEILESDHKKLTKAWTGPTFTRTKLVRRATGRVGPDGTAQFERVPVDEEVADLIAASQAKVFLCSFAFLRNHWDKLTTTHPDIDLLLGDEIHLGWSGPDSAQTASFHMINKRVKHFCGMTGTLIDGRLDSAFPAIHVIEPKYYGSYEGFVHEHAIWVNDYGKVETWGNEAKLRNILARHSVRRTFEEIYGKEDVVFQTQTVPMGPKMRAEYDLFHEQAMLELEDSRILDGTLPGVASMRAQQILGHPETMGLAKGEVTGKDQVLEVFAAERQPMLLFFNLQPEQERSVALLQKLGVRAALINADVSHKKRSQIDKAFRNGELDAIVASGPTAGVGYNWERADHVILGSISYKDVDILQSYRRASRGSRTSTLRVTALAYAKSIDQRKFQIVKVKSELANRVDPTRRVLDLAA